MLHKKIISCLIISLLLLSAVSYTTPEAAPATVGR